MNVSFEINETLRIGAITIPETPEYKDMVNYIAMFDSDRTDARWEWFDLFDNLVREAAAKYPAFDKALGQMVYA